MLKIKFNYKMLIQLLTFFLINHSYTGLTYDSQVGVYKDQTILSSNHKGILH